jgi:beta-aspartyl-peptidase (threonine type)
MTEPTRWRSAPFLAALVALLAMLTPSHAAAGESAKSAEKAVRGVLDEQVRAWNKGDLDGFMAGYWKSPDLTFFSGDKVTRGWEATLERYRKKYQAEGKEMGKLSFKDLDVQVLGPDSAVVRGRFELVTSKDKPTGLFTLLFRRFPEGWRIVHDHTSSG